MSEDVDLFVSSFINCLYTTGGGNVPRPFGLVLFGTKPNELVQFDSIEPGPSRTVGKYVLMVRDDHSGYAWFFPASNIDPQTATNAFLDRCTFFGTPVGLMSDGPSHFTNETLRLLAKCLRTPQHFMLQCCPCSNGAVERLCKKLLCVARAVLSELQINDDDWPQ